MPDITQIIHPGGKVKGTIILPGSKSESNRALIMQALSKGKVKLTGLSAARDTQTLVSLLNSSEKVADVGDAGTTMRFLTAFFSTGNVSKILTGSERMCERPVFPLVNALKDLGFKINYLGKEGFPPIEIIPVDLSQLKNEVSIRGDISSQFISALLMIAPVLPGGLSLKIEGETASRPYIEMTLKMLEAAGIISAWEGNRINIIRQEYKPCIFSIEPDWSAASYWYSIAALSEEAEIVLQGLKENSLQGDRIIAELMEGLGVSTRYTEAGILLKKVPRRNTAVRIDFSSCPDLCQTMAVVCAALNITMEFTGVKSLRIKETDRLAALRNELSGFNMDLIQKAEDLFVLEGTYKHSGNPVKTYEDHRMAMAFAPLALKGKLRVENPEVTVKSYPGFWEELVKAGFSITPEIQ